MTKRTWLSPLVGSLFLASPAAAEELTLTVGGLEYDRGNRTCRIEFLLQSLSGDLPPGLALDYVLVQDGVEIQQCSYTAMGHRDAEYACEGFLTDCEGVGTVVIEHAACLDNLEQEMACGPIVLGDSGIDTLDRRTP